MYRGTGLLFSLLLLLFLGNCTPRIPEKPSSINNDSATSNPIVMIPDFPSEAAQLDSLLTDKQVESTVIPSPFFKQTTIYRLVRKLPSHPIVYYYSKATTGKALQLNGSPLKYQSAAKAEQLHLDNVQDAIAYYKLGFEATMPKTAYIVSSLDEFRFFPQLNPQETERREALTKGYAQQLHPVTGKVIPTGFELELYYILDRQLWHEQTTLHQDGTWTAVPKMLEDALPVVYIR